MDITSDKNVNKINDNIYLIEAPDNGRSRTVTDFSSSACLL